jgi:hypothetical protein
MQDQPHHQPPKAPVRFFTCTSVTDKAWPQTSAGQSHWYLAQDRQAQLRQVFNVVPGQLDATIAEQWQQGVQDMRAGRISGLVWVHPDLVVDDFLAARRLQAYWAGSDQAARSMGIVQHEDQVILRALSARAPTEPLEVRDIREQLALSFHRQPLHPGRTTGTSISPAEARAIAINRSQVFGLFLATTATWPPQESQCSVGANSAAPATAKSRLPSSERFGF